MYAFVGKWMEPAKEKHRLTVGVLIGCINNAPQVGKKSALLVVKLALLQREPRAYHYCEIYSLFEGLGNRVHGPSSQT